MKNKLWPKDTNFGCYYLAEEKSRFKIRQQVTTPDGKRHFPRYPAIKYNKLVQSRAVLQALVDRLNYGAGLKAIRDREVKLSFLPQSTMDAFREELSNSIPNQKDFRYIHSKLFTQYFLGYFVNTLKILDPNIWIKRQSEWGAALLGKSKNPNHNIFESKISPKTIKHTIQVANRFIAFLHLKHPEMYGAAKFAPIGKGSTKAYQAQLEIDNSDKVLGRFITPGDWKKIDAKLPKEIGCFVRLMYCYGLRRGESLGFDSLDAVRKSYIKVSKQLKTMTGNKPGYAILKDKESRETPHWFAEPDLAYRWISEGIDKKIHPDTFSTRWDIFIKNLGMSYRLHDFRRTFITNALRTNAARDVQLAVGHANLATTIGYARDDRALDDVVWKPGVG